MKQAQACLFFFGCGTVQFSWSFLSVPNEEERVEDRCARTVKMSQPRGPNSPLAIYKDFKDIRHEPSGTLRPRTSLPGTTNGTTAGETETKQKMRKNGLGRAVVEAFRRTPAETCLLFVTHACYNLKHSGLSIAVGGLVLFVLPSVSMDMRHPYRWLCVWRVMDSFGSCCSLFLSSSVHA